MKVVVLGSGMVGVTCAYQLANAGHEGTVVDRQSASGFETSYAHAGEVSPGYSAPWAGLASRSKPSSGCSCTTARW